MTFRTRSRQAVLIAVALVAGLLCAAAIAAGSHDPTSRTSSLAPGSISVSGVLSDVTSPG
jgi:hypothetical protein